MAKFEPDFRSIGDYMTDGSLYPALEGPAHAVYERARALASQHVETGAYLESIETARTRDVHRVKIDVRATDPISEVLESEYHILGRAAG